MQPPPAQAAPPEGEPVYVRARLSPGGQRAFRRLLRLVFRLVARVEVRGLEHLPQGGGFIVSPNHLSYFDLPLLFTLMGERPGVVMGAHNYRRKRFFRWFLEGAIGVIWVDRGAIGPGVVRAAMLALQEGNVLGLAPEGTRSRVTHALQEGKTGAAFLALATGAVVLPVGLAGTERIGSALLRLRRAPVSVRIGRPLRLQARGEGGRKGRRPQVQAATDEIMCQIAALLPQEYRGVYAAHPGLAALSGETDLTGLAKHPRSAAERGGDL